jgi:hypothetical protein
VLSFDALKNDRLWRKKIIQGTSPEGAQRVNQLSGLRVEGRAYTREIPHDLETVGIGKVQRHLQNVIRVQIEIIDHYYLMLAQANVLNRNRMVRIYG